LVTEKEIKAFAPHADQRVVNAIVENWEAAEKAGINTPRRIRHFFANIAAETDLNNLTEGMSYSSAENIMATWSKRFKTREDAEPYVRQPELLAEKVYGLRNGNRAGTDDAFRYRGRGLLQTTGYDNYKEQTENLGRKIGADFLKNPEMLADPTYAFLSAVDGWKRRGLNELVDKLDKNGKENTRDIRIRINGGTNGLNKVRKYLAQAEKVWPDGAMQEKVREAAVNVEGATGSSSEVLAGIDALQLQKKMAADFKKSPKQALEDYPDNKSVLAANAVLDGLKEKGGQFRASVPQMRNNLARRIELGQRIPTPQEAMKMVHNALLDRGR